ncbi:MAG: nuclear transport factor 2 family protein [Actinomycetota bacterium]
MTDNAAVLRQAIDDWNAGDLVGYMELYDPSVTLHGVPPGIDAVRSMYAGMWRAFPGSHLSLDDVITEGEKLACRYTWQGSNAKGGETVVMPGVTIMHFRNGKRVERWDFEGTEQNIA